MRQIRQQLYRLLVEDSLGLMCIHDLNGILLNVNPAALQSLQYQEEEGVGHNLREFLVPSVRSLFDDYLSRIRVNATDSGLMRLQAKDGTERIWFYKNIRHDEPGAPSIVLGHALDVTDRVHAEYALKAAQKDLEQAHSELAQRVAERTAELQQANDRLRAEIAHRQQVEEELLRIRKLEAIGVLAGGIAHDLNNFLTVVQGNAALAIQKTGPGAPVLDNLEQITAACGRASFLASQLLTFSKGGAPVRRVGSIAGLLRESAGLAAAGSDTRVVIELDEGLWPVEFDEGQMGQVLHNLLINARESMPGGGVVELRASNVTVETPHEGALPPGRYLLIQVRDHGCGIPEADLPRIFDPYFTTKETGSGLGLATAYSIVAKHQGHLSVQSVVGQGTTFAIHLPAAAEESPPEPVCQSPRVRRGVGRILLMDDESAILRLLSRAVQEFGYEVECAANGQEALTLYERARAAGRGFDAALLDLTVPGGMGGTETAARIRRIDPQARLIVSSGYSESAIMSDYRRFGFDEVLPKPWTLARLRETLGRLLGSR